MVNLKILEEYGCTQERLRQIFTCKDIENQDYKIQEQFRLDIESRIYEGIHWSATNAEIYMAVDLAWDSQPINKATVPLLLYAQGKISMEKAGEKLAGLQCADEFCERDETGAIKNINMARLYEVSMNIIRSYTTRRLAAQVSRFNNLYPY